MVFEINGYKCYKVKWIKYWFYKDEEKVPQDAEPVEKLPDDYVVKMGNNGYPLVKKKKKITLCKNCGKEIPDGELCQLCSVITHTKREQSNDQ